MFLRAYNPCTTSEPLHYHLVSDFNTDTSVLDSLVLPGRQTESFSYKENEQRWISLIVLFCTVRTMVKHNLTH